MAGNSCSSYDASPVRPKKLPAKFSGYVTRQHPEMLDLTRPLSFLYLLNSAGIYDPVSTPTSSRESTHEIPLHKAGPAPNRHGQNTVRHAILSVFYVLHHVDLGLFVSQLRHKISFDSDLPCKFVHPRPFHRSGQAVHDACRDPSGISFVYQYFFDLSYRPEWCSCRE